MRPELMCRHGCHRGRHTYRAWSPRSSPALVSLLDSGAVEVAGTRVLVPGCGRGYDLVEFSRRGAAEAVARVVMRPRLRAALRRRLGSAR